MSIEIATVFPNNTQAARASDALNMIGFKTSSISDAPGFVTIKLESDGHSRRMIRFGLIGLAAGCAAGMLGVSHVHGREMMYLVILPLTTTYYGLALGLFVAMAVERFLTLRDDKESTLIDDFDGSVALVVAVENQQSLVQIQNTLSHFAPSSMIIQADASMKVSELDAKKSERLPEKLVLTKSA
jgi:hypothetical protein